MTRISEIVRGLPTLSDSDREEMLAEKGTATLYRRFVNVNEAISAAVTGNLTVDDQLVERKFKTVNWSGVDRGIHDHEGYFKGTVNGIQLNFNVNGTTCDRQPMFVLNDEGQITLATPERSIALIEGSFVSADGRMGKVDLRMGNMEKPYGAYWLSTSPNRLKLEQLESGGKVYNVDAIADPTSQIVQVPGTYIELNRYIKN